VRREVLYQYDLPIEILNDLPYDEEVLHVLFARSKEKFLIPVLFSRKRIFWGYPEKEAVYKVFELQYVNLVSISAKFPPAVSATLTIHTDLGRDLVFPHLQDSVDSVRGAMLSAADCLREMTSRVFSIVQQKNLLLDEYILREDPDAVIFASDEEIFEDKPVMPLPVQEPAPAEADEDLFARFAREGEDETAETEEDAFFEAAEEPSEEEHASAVVDRIARMVEATEPTADEASPAVLENDVIIYESASASKNEQWHGEGGGDAEILPRGSPWKNICRTPAKTVQEPISQFLPEDDDSEVYCGGERPKLAVPQPKAAAHPVNQDEEVEVIEKVTVLPNPAVKPRAKKSEPLVPAEPVENIEPVMIHRRGSMPAEAVTLQPRDGIDEATVDKSLDALKFLRDNKIISEAEYKKRSLSLFEKEDDN